MTDNETRELAELRAEVAVLRAEVAILRDSLYAQMGASQVHHHYAPLAVPAAAPQPWQTVVYPGTVAPSGALPLTFSTTLALNGCAGAVSPYWVQVP